MSETLTRLVIDCSTGTEAIVPLTPEEILEREALHAAQEDLRAEQEAAQEKAAKQGQEEKAQEVEIEEKQIKPSRPKRSKAPKKQIEGMEL